MKPVVSTTIQYLLDEHTFNIRIQCCAAKDRMEALQAREEKALMERRPYKPARTGGGLGSMGYKDAEGNIRNHPPYMPEGNSMTNSTCVVFSNLNGTQEPTTNQRCLNDFQSS